MCCCQIEFEEVEAWIKVEIYWKCLKLICNDNDASSLIIILVIFVTPYFPSHLIPLFFKLTPEIK